MAKYALSKSNSGFLLLDCLVAMSILLILLTHSVTLIKQIRQSFHHNALFEKTLNNAVNTITSQHATRLQDTPSIQKTPLNTALNMYYAQ